MTIPGVGIMSATAIVLTMDDPKRFRSGRHFAAWLGLVPRQSSSGDRQVLGGISKRGDGYVRTLLIHGARSAVNVCREKTDRKSQWIKGLVMRRNKNIATVALANKNARTIWALLARGEDYRTA